MATGALSRLLDLSGKTDISYVTQQDMDAFEEAVKTQARKDAEPPRQPKPGHTILRVTCANCGTPVIDYPPHFVTCPNREDSGWGPCGD